jgi:hypothetical protein
MRFFRRLPSKSQLRVFGQENMSQGKNTRQMTFFACLKGVFIPKLFYELLVGRTLKWHIQL